MVSIKLKGQSDTRRKHLRCARDSTNLQSSFFNIQSQLVRVEGLVLIQSSLGQFSDL